MLGELPHGNGVIYCNNKILYSGSFKFGKYSGHGTLYNLKYHKEEINYRCIDMKQNYWVRF